MKRYFRLYLKFLEFSFGRAMEFRIDFYFRILMDVIYYVITFSFFKVLFLHSPQIGGWSEAQVRIFIGAYIVVDAFNMTVFANNIWGLPQLVNKGDLDYHLTRPVHSFFMLNFRDIAVNSFFNLLIASSFLVWAIYSYPSEIGAGRILLFLMMLFAGSLLFHFTRLLFMLPVFWTHSGRGLEGVFWNIEKFMERPYGIYKGVAKIIFLTILPFAVMASLPTDILFTANPWPLVAYGTTVVMAFIFLTLKLWDIALRNYSSASS